MPHTVSSRQFPVLCSASEGQISLENRMCLVCGSSGAEGVSVSISVSPQAQYIEWGSPPPRPTHGTVGCGVEAPTRHRSVDGPVRRAAGRATQAAGRGPFGTGAGHRLLARGRRVEDRGEVDLGRVTLVAHAAVGAEDYTERHRREFQLRLGRGLGWSRGPGSQTGFRLRVAACARVPWN